MSNKRYKTHIKYRVIWIPSVLTVFWLRTFSCEVKVLQSVLTMNKTQLVSFFVYRRHSQDHFRIVICLSDNKTGMLDTVNGHFSVLWMAF